MDDSHDALDVQCYRMGIDPVIIVEPVPEEGSEEVSLQTQLSRVSAGDAAKLLKAAARTLEESAEQGRSDQDE